MLREARIPSAGQWQQRSATRKAAIETIYEMRQLRVPEQSDEGRRGAAMLQRRWRVMRVAGARLPARQDEMLKRRRVRRQQRDTVAR